MTTTTTTTRMMMSSQEQQEQTDSDFELARRIQAAEEAGAAASADGPTTSHTRYATPSPNSATAAVVNQEWSDEQGGESNNFHKNNNKKKTKKKNDKSAANNHSNTNDDDERLARLMAATGRSLRDMNEDELQELSECMEAIKNEEEKEEKVNKKEEIEEKEEEDKEEKEEEDKDEEDEGAATTTTSDLRPMGPRQTSFLAPLRNDRHRLHQTTTTPTRRQSRQNNKNNDKNNNNNVGAPPRRTRSGKSLLSALSTSPRGLNIAKSKLNANNLGSSIHSCTSSSQSKVRSRIFRTRSAPTSPMSIRPLDEADNGQTDSPPPESAIAAKATTRRGKKKPPPPPPLRERLYAAATPKPPPRSFSGSSATSSGGGGGGAGVRENTIPGAIPPPPRRDLARLSTPCAKCGLADGTLLKAKDRYYHPECFRCGGCNLKIDLNCQFAFRSVPASSTSTTSRPTNGVNKNNSSSNNNNQNQQLPYHAACLPVSDKARKDICVVCQQPIPMGPGGGGMVVFVKHPFFENEHMCPKHAEGMHRCRRCSGCHRFEPMDQPFADLDDAGRCVCLACCRTVITNDEDAQPLWQQVIAFFEDQMNLTVWKGMRNIPVLLVGYQDLARQIARDRKNVYGMSSQIMSQGFCLTDRDEARRRRLPRPARQFHWSQGGSVDDDASPGFQYDHEEVFGMNHYHNGTNGRSRATSSTTSPNEVFAIMCLKGLPRDLTAAILAHEATHAWIHMHPDYDHNIPLDPQVEEGLAQLVAMLFLNEGLEPITETEPSQQSLLSQSPASSNSPLTTSSNTRPSPTDEQLRQYFRFCIESDEHEIFGKGYKKAAQAYREVGIQPLLTHVVLNGTFPEE